jgi:uncharacterized protein involved in cysteine biosynthesis
VHPAAPARSRPRDLVDGAACLVRGLGIFARTPGLWAMGLLPALIALVALGILLGVLVAELGSLVGALTPFAAAWDPSTRDAVRFVVGLAVVAGSLWLAMVSYTALAIAIGQPFYEAIARRVDEAEGGLDAPVPHTPWLRDVGRALRDGLFLVILTAGLGVLMLVLGFVPLIGQTVVPVVGACVTGFFLSVELSSVALERRGFRVGDRLRMLWRRKLLAVGFGVAAFLLFLIPLGAVLGMPGAIAGGTLLARRLRPGG